MIQESSSDSELDELEIIQEELIKFIKTNEDKLNDDCKKALSNKKIMELSKYCEKHRDPKVIYDSKFRSLVASDIGKRLADCIFGIIDQLKVDRSKDNSVKPPLTSEEICTRLSAEIGFNEISIIFNFFCQLMAISLKTIAEKSEIDDNDVNILKQIYQYYPTLKSVSQVNCCVM